MEITLDDVKTFIEANKSDPSVSEFIVAISVDKPLNPELVTAYLSTVEGKNIINPMIDSRVTQAVKTHDENSKPKIEAAIKAGIAAEMLRMNPTETPEQRQVRELMNEQKRMQEDWEKDKKRAQIEKLAFNNKINPEFIEGLNFASVEEADLYMKRFNDYTNKNIEKQINERMGQEAYKPKSGKQDEKKLDLSKLSASEMLKLEMEGKLDEIMAS